MIGSNGSAETAIHQFRGLEKIVYQVDPLTYNISVVSKKFLAQMSKEKYIKKFLTYIPQDKKSRISATKIIQKIASKVPRRGKGASQNQHSKHWLLDLSLKNL